jgi:Protein of unknown function (DUF2800)
VSDHAAHSLLGASGASRWLKCPGSFRLSQSAPAAPTSVYAARGTLAHTLIESNLKFGNRRVGDNTLGVKFTVEGHEFIIDQDMIDGVDVMLEYCMSQKPAYDRMFLETRVSLDPYFNNRKPPPVRLFGRADVIFTGEPVIEIVDYKNGSGVLVSPEDNPQCLYYAAGVVAKLMRDKPDIDIHTVRLTIVQPHARSVAKVRTATIDYIDLMLWVDDVLIPGVEACADPAAPLHKGSWCLFCPVAFACPALIEDATRMAKIEFDDDRVRVDDPVELGELLDVAARARAWCDAIEVYGLEQLKRQVRVPGWSLVPTRPVRRWSDVDAVLKELHSTGMDHRAVEWKLRSPAQVEKLVRQAERSNQISPDAWDRLSPLVESHSSGVKLQRVTLGNEDFDPV